MSIYPPRKYEKPVKRTEFDIIKSEHKFLRDDDVGSSKERSWDEQLARKYEDSLFREFAVCDLKHYKSGNIAMRWRTEDEVLSGAGETTCGNTRCPLHTPPPSGPSSLANVRWEDDNDRPMDKQKKKKSKALLTLELPFSYIEDNNTKSALVKVVLCEKCVRKINWKREKSRRREEEMANTGTEHAEHSELDRSARSKRDVDSKERKQHLEGGDMIRQDLPSSTQREHRRTRQRSRSLSPRSHVRYGPTHDIRDQWTL